MTHHSLDTTSPNVIREVTRVGRADRIQRARDVERGVRFAGPNKVDAENVAHIQRTLRKLTRTVSTRLRACVAVITLRGLSLSDSSRRCSK